MSIPQTEIAVKRVLEYVIKLIQSDPDRHLLDIFGDLKLEPNQALYGARVIEQIKAWVASTKITITTGYQIDQTELPCVSVNMGQSSPAQKFLGDHGGQQFQHLTPGEREVVVPAFGPASLTISQDRQYATFSAPTTLSTHHQQLILPGLHLLDDRQTEYGIGFDDVLNLPTILPLGDLPEQTIDAGNFSQITVISPLKDARFRDGVMLYQEIVNIDVHGNQNKNEAKWLWAMMVWGLQRFRPIMESVFSLALSDPSSSDIEIDPSFQGTNIWVRRITLQTKVVWSWRGVRLQDAIGLIMCINDARASSGDEHDEVVGGKPHKHHHGKDKGPHPKV